MQPYKTLNPKPLNPKPLKKKKKQKKTNPSCPLNPEPLTSTRDPSSKGQRDTELAKGRVARKAPPRPTPGILPAVLGRLCNTAEGLGLGFRL